MPFFLFGDFWELQCSNSTRHHFLCHARPFLVWVLLPLVFGTVFVHTYYHDLLACTFGVDFDHTLHALTLTVLISVTGKYGPKF